MALFKRRNNEKATTAELVAPPPSWRERLGLVGDALDGTNQDMRDLAIVLEGGPADQGAMINLLGYRQTSFHAGWASLMYRLETGEAELTNHATGNTEGAGPPAMAAAPEIGPWGLRLRAVGLLIDTRRPSLLSPTLVFLPGGVVVNGIDMATVAGAGGTLVSFELGNEEIRDTASTGSGDRPVSLSGR